MTSPEPATPSPSGPADASAPSHRFAVGSIRPWTPDEIGYLSPFSNQVAAEDAYVPASQRLARTNGRRPR